MNNIVIKRVAIKSCYTVTDYKVYHSENDEGRHTDGVGMKLSNRHYNS